MLVCFSAICGIVKRSLALFFCIIICSYVRVCVGDDVERVCEECARIWCDQGYMLLNVHVFVHSFFFQFYSIHNFFFRFSHSWSFQCSARHPFDHVYVFIYAYIIFFFRCVVELTCCCSLSRVQMPRRLLASTHTSYIVLNNEVCVCVFVPTIPFVINLSTYLLSLSEWSTVVGGPLNIRGAGIRQTRIGGIKGKKRSGRWQCAPSRAANKKQKRNGTSADDGQVAIK